jgi:hypothetical protein
VAMLCRNCSLLRSAHFAMGSRFWIGTATA